MKQIKWIKLLLSLTIVVVAFTGCSATKQMSLETSEEKAQGKEQQAMPPEEKTIINMAVLKGPTGIGAALLIEDAEDGSTYNQYKFTIAASPDEVIAKVINGEIDVAAVPTNMAALLYNKTEGNIKMAGINTLGVLHILEKGDSIHTLQDLSGKTIYASGMGATPEYVLNYLLEKNNIDATVVYKNEHAEVVSALLSDEASIALLPEPNVTTAMAQDEAVRLALDLNKEWETATGSQLPMGCIIANSAFIENNKIAFEEFLKEYNDSIRFTNSDPAAAADLIEKFGIVPKSSLALKAIPNCHIVFIEGDEMQKNTDSFFNILMEANPKAIGGTLPDEAFYYKK